MARTEKTYKDLFDEGGCLNRNTIARFIDGTLSVEELKAVHKHANTCELCNSAISGASLFEDSTVYNSRLNAMQSSFTVSKPKSNRKLYFFISSAAASVILAIGVFLLVQHSPKSITNELMARYENTVVDDYSKGLIVPMDKVQVPDEPAKPEFKLEVTEDDVVLETAMEYENIEIDKLELIAVADKRKKGEQPASEPSAEIREEYEESILSNVAEQAAEQQEPSIRSKSARVSKRLSRRRADNYYVAELTPLFKGGGMNFFKNYVLDSINIKDSHSVFNNPIIVAFVIDTFGNVDKVEMISGTDSTELNNKIIEIIQSSPQWIPAQLSGNSVPSEQELQIGDYNVD